MHGREGGRKRATRGEELGRRVGKEGRGGEEAGSSMWLLRWGETRRSLSVRE